MQKDFAKAGIFKLGNDIFVFTGPLVLNGVISFLTSSQPLWVGVSIIRGCVDLCTLFLYISSLIKQKVVWTAGLFVGSAIQSLCSNQYFFRGYRVGLHVCFSKSIVSLLVPSPPLFLTFILDENCSHSRCIPKVVQIDQWGSAEVDHWRNSKPAGN